MRLTIEIKKSWFNKLHCLFPAKNCSFHLVPNSSQYIHRTCVPLLPFVFSSAVTAYRTYLNQET